MIRANRVANRPCHYKSATLGRHVSHLAQDLHSVWPEGGGRGPHLQTWEMLAWLSCLVRWCSQQFNITISGKLPKSEQWRKSAALLRYHGLWGLIAFLFSAPLQTLLAEQWGLLPALQRQHENTFFTKAGFQSRYVQLVRWKGRRRRRDIPQPVHPPHHHRRGCPVISEVRRGLTFSPHPTRLMTQLLPSPVYGMQRDQGLARALQRRIPLRGGFPRGRTYPWHVDVGDRWRDLHWEIARVLRRGAATFQIIWQGNVVDMQQLAADGPHHIELRRIPPDLQQRARSRSRDPDYVDASSSSSSNGEQHSDVEMEQRGLLPNTPSHVEDADRIDFGFPMRCGTWYLPIYLQDFQAQSWEEVTALDAELTLRHVYRSLLDRAPRLTLAHDGTVLREGDTLQALARDREGQAIPQWGPGLGTHRKSLKKQRKDYAQQTLKALKGKDLKWIHLWWKGSWKSFPFYNYTLKGPCAYGALRRQVGAAMTNVGYALPNYLLFAMDGRVLQPIEPFCMEDHDGLVVIPDELHGANKPPPDSIKAKVAAVRRAVEGRLKGNQVRLLLKGDENFRAKMNKIEHDVIKLRNLALETAKRYQMVIAGDAKDAQAPVQSERSTPKDQKTVKSSSQTAKTAEPPPRPRLDPTHWSVPPMEVFKLGCNGVFLETDMAVARQHAAQLQGTSATVALLSVQPLETAKHTEKLHFLLLKDRPGASATQQVVEGFLNQFSDTRVRHMQQVGQLRVSKGEPSTVVISVQAVKATVSGSEWQSLSKCTTISALKAALASVAPALSYEDLFKIQVTPDRVTFLARIRKSALSSWLLADTLPCTCVPLGDSMDQFKVLWDKSVTTLGDLRMKYSSLRGYAGAVQTAKGLGARFRAAEYDHARASTGLPEGEAWILKGIPIDLPVEHLESMLQDMQWSAVIQADTRQTRGRTASVRARATHPPPATLYRVAVGDEAFTIHIAQPAPRKRPVKETKQEPPVTWAEAARRALGRSNTSPAAATTTNQGYGYR